MTCGYARVSSLLICDRIREACGEAGAKPGGRP